jgi:hypothetical protein
MTVSQINRQPPNNAERWFYAPRNHSIPSPNQRDVLGSGFGTGGDGVAAYRGASLPPSPASFMSNGGLFLYNEGWLFLPFDSREAQNWIDEFGVPIDMAVGAIAGLFLPLGNIFLEATRDVFVSEFFFGKAKTEQSMRELEARWKHPNLLIVPYIDVVEAAYITIRGRGLFAKRTGYVAVTAEKGDGESISYVLTPAATDIASGLFTVRMAREFEYVKALVAKKLMDYHERARDALATLGIYVTASEVNLSAIGEALRLVHAEGRTHELEGVTVGQVADVLTHTGNTAWKEVQERLGDELPAEMARLVLNWLEPMLPHYRRVPAMAHQIEVFERVAGGETDRNWTPAWHPRTCHFNFKAEGEKHCHG